MFCLSLYHIRSLRIDYCNRIKDKVTFFSVGLIDDVCLFLIMMNQRNANRSVSVFRSNLGLFCLSYCLSLVCQLCCSLHSIAIHVTPCFLIVTSHFQPFCFFPPHCISIHFHLLPPQIIWREGADRIWGVTEESFWVHKWFNEDRLHHHSSAQGNHIC